VIIPSFNFPSAANAVALAGATPVFCDVRLEGMTASANDLSAATTDRTRAVIWLPYGGYATYAAEVADFARSRRLWLIEDAAHAVGIRTQEGTVGAHGHLAVHSFHETKNFQCGEGGALRINDSSLVDRAHILQEKGTDRLRFRQGLVRKYTWQDIGSSWVLSDLNASMLEHSLRYHQMIQKRRAEITNRYHDELGHLVTRRGWQTTPRAIDQDEPGHLFGLVLSGIEERSLFMKFLDANGIPTAIHYQALHASKAGHRLSRSVPCPNSLRLSDSLVRLPLHYELNDQHQALIIEAIHDFADREI